mgnify:CR=1 FL=1
MLLSIPAAMAQTRTYLFAPLVFEQQLQGDTLTLPSAGDTAACRLQLDDAWLTEARAATQRTRATRTRAIVRRPDLVRYNMATLPAAPQGRILKAVPRQGLLTVTPPEAVKPDLAPVDTTLTRIHHWLHTFGTSLHFTQAYISGNWYQGGENSLTLLADVQWDCNLNQNLHPNWLFNNTVHYKLGLTTQHGDSLRKYSINEDNFLLSSQLGYKAVKHWYYSAMLTFKTQFFRTYATNSAQPRAAFLSPAELNLGLGMTYDITDKDGHRTFKLAVAPLSYNMKICEDIVNLNPVNFGIDAGHHTKHSFGSNLEANIRWQLHPNITWTSRFYVFTDYDYLQGDWENTLDMSITKHLNTKLYTHLRYDKSNPKDKDWRYWQFKEILSLGVVYRFATL